ncbi:ImmA/IrrE family metallo-endopeptidase [Corynebacterium phoceense]|uniref:ImmA/IrrE family metallo-endopeptidase n=1 Tax=Corynebacterium phoceense TaxID=1686286 RepID=UPI00211C3A38|nr:ImmA/IrrE family metallo-endopeptidase [Corynebacterium phoceense]MCQ9348679.1 ImmA/IrrE family metallo-endopeptidase [Corynebacterium phoceense]
MELSSALRAPEDFFWIDDLPELNSDTVNFRAGRKAEAVHRRAATNNGRLLFRLDGWIHDNFALPPLDWLDLSHETPRLAARLLREAWGLGSTNPAPNMVQLCESRGISVYGLTDIALAVDAFSLWHESRPIIFVSRRKTPERSRFDIAHELGHIILHHDRLPSDESSVTQESEADAFASEFLIPQAALTEYLPSLPRISDILNFRSSFRVSAMATTVALHRAGRLTDSAYKRRCLDLRRQGFKTGEPNGMTAYERSRIMDHVFSTCREPSMTRTAAAAELSLPTDVIDHGTFKTQLRAVA